jgi:hypothetical protein
MKTSEFQFFRTSFSLEFINELYDLEYKWTGKEYSGHIAFEREVEEELAVRIRKELTEVPGINKFDFILTKFLPGDYLSLHKDYSPYPIQVIVWLPRSSAIGREFLYQTEKDKVLTFIPASNDAAIISTDNPEYAHGVSEYIEGEEYLTIAGMPHIDNHKMGIFSKNI